MTGIRILSLIFGVCGVAFMGIGIGQEGSGLVAIGGAILVVSFLLLVTSGRCGACCRVKGRSGPPSSGDGDAAMIASTTAAVGMMAASTMSSD